MTGDSMQGLETPGLAISACPHCGGTLIREAGEAHYECQMGCGRWYRHRGGVFLDVNGLPELAPLRLERAGYEPYDRSGSAEQKAAGHRRGRPMGYSPSVIREALAAARG